METALTMRSWLEQSKELFIPLSNAEVSAVCDKTGGDVLHSLRQWMVANPCPDRLFGDRVNMIMARCGYVALICAADQTSLDQDQQTALTERHQKLNGDLAALIAEVETFETEYSASPEI